MVMLEIAAGLVSGPDVGVRQAKVLLREQGKKDWVLSLYGSGTMESIDAVVNRDADVAIANPSAALMLAHRRHAPYTKPLPVEKMCRDSPETPLDVPLHPAAERFWRERGYL